MTSIYIPHWFKDLEDPREHPGFQHYGERDPIWIKNYTRLLSDQAYLDLTWPQTGVLHALWLEYARSGRQLPGDTAALSRRFGKRVPSATLESLNHAGFIVVSASTPLASRYHAASAEKSREEEKDLVKGESVTRDQRGSQKRKQADPDSLDAAARLAEQIGADDLTSFRIADYAKQLPEAAFHSVRQQLVDKGSEIGNPAGYAINALRSMVSEGQYGERTA